LFAQIGVGTSSPNATAKFQVDASASTNAKGFLGPRIALTSTTSNAPFSVTPATGLMVYNTATAGSGSTEVTPGYYSYNGSGWERLATNPTTFVNGTSITTFPPAPMTITSPYSYSYGPLAEISLPPGRWEVTGEFTCFAEMGFNVVVFESRENTYWLSESSTYSNLPPVYPLPLNSLASGGPTADAIFSGGAVTLLPVELHSDPGGASPTRNPRQIMKFYISNTSGGNKSYYLHWHESYYKSDYGYGLDGMTPTYKSSAAENRFYAIKIQ
jgi:hypothetical protein